MALPHRPRYPTVADDSSQCPKSSSIIGRTRRPYEPAEKLETARVRKVGACMQCRQKKVKCRHTIETGSSVNSTSNHLISAGLVHARPVSDTGTATSYDTDMPMSDEIGTLPQTMSVGEDSSFLRDRPTFHETAMVSWSSKNDNRFMVGVKPYGDVFGNIQALGIDTYPNDQPGATFAHMPFSDVPSRKCQQKSEQFNMQQTVDVDKVTNSPRKYSTHGEMDSNPKQQPWTPRMATKSFQESQNMMVMDPFQYGPMLESQLGVSFSPTSPSLQRCEYPPGHLDGRFHSEWQPQPHPVHGADVVYDTSYPRGFQVPRSDFDDVVESSSLPFGFEELSESASTSDPYLAPPKTISNPSFVGASSLSGEFIPQIWTTPARQSSSELGTFNGNLDRNAEPWKKTSTCFIDADMSEGMYMVEEAEDMADNWYRISQ
ncbi:hypothetical protein BDZ45DRAFT_799745 [Acephala macrosclerotiorum]|nr:hypothetical protein BDZ45DRAFT_799745 [Acephala macrosclerotiorum]